MIYVLFIVALVVILVMGGCGIYVYYDTGKTIKNLVGTVYIEQGKTEEILRIFNEINEALQMLHSEIQDKH